MINFFILKDLIKADFRNRYLGHHLGIIWALIQPLVMVAVYWFVFTQGLRITNQPSSSFLLWLFAGMVPWFFISDSITLASHSITSQAYLVKKIVFDVKLLPLVKIGSSLIVNIGFWLFLLILCLYNHHYPTLLWLQLLYYFTCGIIICWVFSLFFASIMPFAADLGQIINIIMQILFWVTPVTWSYKNISEKFIAIVKYNPFAYIVNGVRDTLIDNLPFWNNFDLTLYFWFVTIAMYMISNLTFKQLRPHFADVL